MINGYEQPTPEQFPWPEATSEYNCFQNGMMALLTTLDKRSRQSSIAMPRIWVTSSEVNGDHAYLEWKGKVFNKGTTAVEGSGFYIGPDLNFEELQEQAVDRTNELLQEFITALEGGSRGSHNFVSMLPYMSLDRDTILKLAKEALSEG